MERRIFLKNTAILSTTMVIHPVLDTFIEKPKKRQIGIQLYTVRDLMKENAQATLQKIAKIGYDHVECAGYTSGKFYNMSRKDFKQVLDDHGLKMWSGHTQTTFGKPKGTYGLDYSWEAVCEDAAFVGQKYIGCGYFAEGERKSLDDYKRHAALFNVCAEKAKEYQLTFFHHNHDFEFFPIDGQLPYDILMQETDPSLVKFELDHFWTTKAKIDSMALIKKNPGRFPLFHIKDMNNEKDAKFTEVGTGIIDYKKLINEGYNHGLDLFYIEQDDCLTMPPLESVTKSYQYVKSILSVK